MYDSTNTKRRSKIYRHISAFAFDGQKSAYESFISKESMLAYLEFLTLQLNPKEDKVNLFKTVASVQLGKQNICNKNLGVIIL